ncbi:hypothetical protein Trydic_g17627 [Trypoxylus dichotomus]
MMFRQILIREEDRRYQTIRWREDSNEPLKFYTLNTVTYGTASAPFLAARTLRQLAIEDGNLFPLAKNALENNFYMDDVLTGANTIEKTIELQRCQVESDTDKNDIFTKTGAQRYANIGKGRFEKQGTKHLAMVRLNNCTIVAKNITNKTEEWHFIPPRAPHFGGLWESNIKSLKTHFCKMTKNLILTFEEAYALLTEIEAIMNSRPLGHLSSDPNDPKPLTPDHFLIGDQMLELCSYQHTEVPRNRLLRREHLQYLKQHFWNRWRREYLDNL